jgi:DNA polymerase III alpha subunit (gram-positive type)
VKYVNQYSITLDDNFAQTQQANYPYFLPYTIFVVDVNDHFKKYFDEIFEYIKPIFTDYDIIVQSVTRDFLKKLNESFLLFTNSIDQDLSVILLAQICNNIRFILKSYDFYESYIMKKANLKSKINFESEKSLKEVW